MTKKTQLRIIYFSFFKDLTGAESGELPGAAGTLGAVCARLALLVHLPSDVVPTGSVVAGVELGEPLALAVLG